MDLKNYISSERGRATALAKHMQVTTSYISQLASGLTISPERALQIEQFTEKLVTRQEMLPDRWEKIWPDLKALQPETGHGPTDRRQLDRRNDNDRRTVERRDKSDRRASSEVRA